MPGIIPARAGFTGPRPASRRPSGDHPRSRGVYRRDGAGGRPAGGSSPLARGLQHESIIGAHTQGIIPARAGFTAGSWSSRPAPMDHPRSRGVYRPLPPGRHRRSGSSPLARGLPSGRSARRREPSDHPRSRGVYVLDALSCEDSSGSSPLARGLPSACRARAVSGGIIPARAGFTRARVLLPGLMGDHPRSRGVYPPQSGPGTRPGGSSPLARGLLSIVNMQLPSRGIIPARAGFTHDHSSEGLPVGDHPRSRGVYPAPLLLSARPLGSSPLARGLHHVMRPGRTEPGIIPARAGFTGLDGVDGAGRRDHPRSRGVYRGRPRGRAHPRGSSPLARGLLSRRAAQSSHHGIIPARAGFTRA